MSDRTPSSPSSAPDRPGSERPRVSIVMPTYNRAHMVAEAVRCVTEQTFDDLELVLVNDGSTDETETVIERLAEEDDRIRVFHKPNSGIANTLNYGFERARGELVTWSSDDNYYEPTAIEEMVAFLDAHPEVDFVYTDAVDIDAEGEEIGVWEAGPPERLRIMCNIRGCALYRRDVLEAAGPFDPTWKIAQDYDFYRRCLANVRVAYLPKALYRYTVHEASMSGDHVGSVFEFGEVCEKYAESPREAREMWARCYANLATHHWKGRSGLKSVWWYLRATLLDRRYLPRFRATLRGVVSAKLSGGGSAEERAGA